VKYSIIAQTLERSLYSMRSLILSQWREHRMGVIWQDLGALMTIQAREFWICWRLLEFIAERITVFNLQ